MAANTNTIRYVAIAALVAVAIGSVLVWATVSAGGFSIDVKGTDRGKDGTFTLTLILALVAVACIFLQVMKSWLIWAGLALAGLCLAIGIYDTLDISHLADDSAGIDVSVGIGLWIVDIGSAVAIVAAYLSRSASRVGPAGYDGSPAA